MVACMHPERALEHLNEARRHVDDDVGEYIDTVAQLMLLQQDISEPMLGAKVTLWLRPPTEERREVPPEDAPDPDGDEWNWQWTVGYDRDGDEKRYWHRPKVNEGDPDIVAHEAIVIEGNVAGDAPDGELWDPNEQEYRTADEYPLGTVNVVVAQDFHGDEVPQDLKPFSEGYATDVEVFTSITPADGEPSAHTYTPGWS